MNERDKEFAKQAWTENDWDGHVDIPKLIDLIRADEREALEKIDWTAVMREGSLVTWADAQELGDRVLAAIRARSGEHQ
jgi:hypothetical protein